MASTGSGTPATFLDSKTVTGLTAGGAGAGWTVIENAGDGSPDVAFAATGTDVTNGVNGGGIGATCWLIGAFAPGFGGGALDSLVDCTRLLSVSTRDARAEAPEPASLALVLAALLAMARAVTRRAPARSRYASLRNAS
jgi:hypothetical protein